MNAVQESFGIDEGVPVGANDGINVDNTDKVLLGIELGTLLGNTLETTLGTDDGTTLGITLG